MSRSNWLLIVALGIVALLTCAIGIRTWPSVPALASYGEANPKNNQYRPGGQRCDPVTLAATRNSRELRSKAEACAKEAEEYRQNTNDLVQQTRAADAAQAQADIASQQLWTGWLQTLGGFLTLAAAVGAAVYARDAARETKRGANSAEKALAHGQATSAAHLRPYVVPYNINFSISETGRVTITAKFFNTGVLPAHNVYAGIGMIFRRFPVSGEIQIAETFGLDYQIIVSNSRKSFLQTYIDFTQDQIAAVQTQSAAVIVEFTLFYRPMPDMEHDMITRRGMICGDTHRGFIRVIPDSLYEARADPNTLQRNFDL